MTRRLRVLRLRRRPILPWALVATVFALAWILELWLLILFCAVGVIALIRFRRWHRRTVLPAVVAGTATARPPGTTPAIAVEEWAAIWLAVISGGRPHWLGRAARLVARTEEDPWAAHVAITVSRPLKPPSAKGEFSASHRHELASHPGGGWRCGAPSPSAS